MTTIGKVGREIKRRRKLLIAISSRTTIGKRKRAANSTCQNIR